MARAIDKYVCPFCGQKTIFVGVHDDEGNYHGLVGCEYENDPWSGLSYALHHEGWGDCPLCTDGAYSTMGGMLFDTAEEAINALTPPNEPLMPDELKEMGGKPVWTVGVSYTDDGKWAMWDIVEKADDEGVDFGYSTESREWWNYNLRDKDGKLLNCAWVCYRRPPEGEEDI